MCEFLAGSMHARAETLMTSVSEKRFIFRNGSTFVRISLCVCAFEESVAVVYTPVDLHASFNLEVSIKATVYS